MTHGSQRSLSLGGIGARLELRLGGPRVEELESRLRTAWARCLDPVGGVDAGSLPVALLDPPGELANLDRDAEELFGDDVELLLLRTTQAVTTRLIEARAGDVLMFHAGAVCHPVTGASLVFVAESGTGKTTLTRTLAGHYGYLTDETVAITTQNRIVAYPKPLSVRSQDSYFKQDLAPDDLLAAPGHIEPQVARLVLLDRDDDHHGEPSVEELDLFDAITALAPQTSSLHSLPRGLHRCAQLIEATGPVLRVRYREAPSLAPLAAQLIGEVS